MKNIAFVFVVGLFSIVTSFGQHQTLFNNARVVGGFGAPIIEWGINGDFNTSVGGGGGIVIDNFFLGGYGLGSVDFDRLFEEGEVESLEIAHGGFWLGFNFNPHNVIHLYTSGRIGWGALDIRFNDNNIRYTDLDKIFVATPEIGLELNITRWFRAAGTVGYRFVNGVEETASIKEDDFNGAVASLALRFGWFGSRYGGKNRNRW